MTYDDTGRELARRMLNHSLTNGELRHREHVQLAYYYLERHDYQVAKQLIALSLRDFAAFNGHADKFHTTLTACWTHFVAAAMSAQGHHSSFEELLASHPDLLRKELPTHYYSRSILLSPAARESFVDPDIRPLPEIRRLRGDSSE